MSDLYLIAHLVRGEPAFDIASQIETEGETIWIIPTSGHRAWPYWYITLNELVPTELVSPCIQDGYDEEDTIGNAFANGQLPPPKDWPDHYSTSTTPKGSLTNLAAALGFKREEVKRRV